MLGQKPVAIPRMTNSHTSKIIINGGTHPIRTFREFECKTPSRDQVWNKTAMKGFVEQRGHTEALKEPKRDGVKSGIETLSF